METELLKYKAQNVASSVMESKTWLIIWTMLLSVLTVSIASKFFSWFYDIPLLNSLVISLVMYGVCVLFYIISSIIVLNKHYSPAIYQQLIKTHEKMTKLKQGEEQKDSMLAESVKEKDQAKTMLKEKESMLSGLDTKLKQALGNLEASQDEARAKYKEYRASLKEANEKIERANKNISFLKSSIEQAKKQAVKEYQEEQKRLRSERARKSKQLSK